jgi:hypothetical protein
VNNKIPLLDLQYFPSLEYFVCISNNSKILIEANESYEKQSYRNRCYILGSNKIQALTVPVLNGNSKVFVKDIRIDSSQKWLNIHWRSIASAYGKSPYFLFFGDYLKEILFKKHIFLFDLNMELLYKILTLLGLKVEIGLTSQYNKEVENNVLDLRSVIHPKRNYEMNNLYKTYSYHQIFGREFVENLSILDLLFCEGRNAVKILEKSTQALVSKA